MNPGAKFEELVKKSFEEEGIFIKRIKTRMTDFKGDNEIADFYVFNDKKLIFLEAKSTQSDRLAFDMIQPNQAVGLYQASKFEDIYGGVIVEMRKFDRYFYIPIELIDYYISKGEMSMNISDLNLHARELSRRMNQGNINVKQFGKGVKGVTYSVPKKEERE